MTRPVSAANDPDPRVRDRYHIMAKLATPWAPNTSENGIGSNGSRPAATTPAATNMEANAPLKNTTTTSQYRQSATGR